MDFSPTDRARSAEIAVGEEVRDILDAISRASAESVRGLKTAVAAESLRDAAKMLDRACSICVAGLDDAFAVAALLAGGLAERGCRCGVLGPDGEAARRQTFECGKGGLLIVIELPDGRLPGSAIDTFRMREAPILAVGESAAGPSGEYCDLRVAAPSSRMVRGMPMLAGQITAAQAMLVALDRLRAGPMV